MNAAICADEYEDIEQLIGALRRYFKGRENELGISCFFDVWALSGYRFLGNFDLIIIKIKADTSLCHDRLERYGKNIIVIGDCDIEGALRVACPFDENGIFLALSSFEKSLCKTLSVYCGGKTAQLPCDDITFIESRGNVCMLHTSSGDSCFVRDTLASLERTLGNSFIRCHRSYIVNMKHIRETDTDFVMTTGERVLIRQKEQRRIKEMVREYRLKQRY